MAKLIDGRELADFIKQRHYQQVRTMDEAPVLAVVVGKEDEAAKAYARVKQSYAEDIGIGLRLVEADGTTDGFLRAIKSQLDADGIIVQLPLPDGCDEDKVLAAIPPAKDVDGLTQDSAYDPATPTGILWLLSASNLDIKGKTVAVVGQGRLVGAPLSSVLEDSGAKVVRCDEHTKDLATETLQADIVVTAVGQPGLIKTGMVKPGAAVIDAGTSKLDGKLVGDVDQALFDRDDISITPTPGGVGPMTVAALFDNLLRAAQRSA